MRTALAALIAASALASAAQAAAPGIPAIYVNYNPDCTFTMSVDGGINVSPDATIPPGNYQLLVSMPNPGSGYSCGVPMFTFAGPGVSAQVTFAGQQFQGTNVLPALQPSSTYIAEDANVPGSTLHTITTAATGSSSSLLQPTTSTASGTNTQPDLVGSAPFATAPALVASVTGGKPALKLHGKTVATLKAGRYRIEPNAALVRAGFVVKGDGRTIRVTKALKITLTAGQWKFTGARATLTVRVQ
jgi:hypothetical protein